MDLWDALSPETLGIVKSSSIRSTRLKIASKILRAQMDGYPHVDMYIYKAEDVEALRQKGFNVHSYSTRHFYGVSWTKN